MAGSTTNLGLTKPTYSEDADIAVINTNMDTLDSKIGAVGSTSLQAQITSANEAIATIGALPSDTTVTSLDAIKTVLKNTFDGIASGARKTVAFVTNNYSGDYFEIAKRYAGILEKTSLTSATCRLSNNNSHFVTVGLVVSSGTYTWTFTSLSDQIAECEAFTLTAETGVTITTQFCRKMNNFIYINVWFIVTSDSKKAVSSSLMVIPSSARPTTGTVRLVCPDENGNMGYFMCNTQGISVDNNYPLPSINGKGYRLSFIYPIT